MTAVKRVTPQQDNARLYQWIARASFPEERLNCKAFAFRAEQDEVILKSRRNSWEQTLCHSAQGKAEILRRRGLSQQQWCQSVQDVDVVAAEYLPDWAKTFIDLYEHWQQHGEKINAKPPDDNPYLLLAAVWAKLCLPWLNAQQHKLESAEIRLTQQSIDDLLESVMMRLTAPLFHVLTSYPSSSPVSDDETRKQLIQTLSFWQRMFDRQPILVKIIGNLVHNWQVATEEMLDRFIADLPQIQSHLWQTKEAATNPIVVSRLLCGLGDPHRGGRSVAIFETNCGDVVYKPKDLIGTWATGLLLQKLHQMHSEFVPLAPEFLYCEGYGWEQRVYQRECDQLAEVETFYRRLGGWLCLIQLFNGNDFWYDNLIAAADMPYFIDYETIVGNSFYDYWMVDGGLGEHIDQIQKMSVVGILPLLMPGSVDFALTDGIDISVTTPPGKQRIPFLQKKQPSKKQLGKENVDENIGVGFFDDFEASDYAPFYQGQFQDINAFFDIFIDGYKRMGNLLKSDVGGEVLQQFYQRIENARFRHIVVDTWQCYSLLSNFFSNCGIDGVRASITLDQFFIQFKYLPYSIVEGIRNDIWHNDIPLFEMQNDNLKLFNTSGVSTEEDFFKQTALARITHNYAYLLNGIERQVGYAKALFSTRPDSPRQSWRQSDTNDVALPVAREELLVLAQEIGHQLATIINQTDSLKGYPSISRLQLNNICSPQPLSVDFDGCSGMIVLLSLLQSGSSDYSEALGKGYQYLTDSTITNYQSTSMTKNSGVFTLPGSKLTALCHLAGVEPVIDSVVANIEKLVQGMLQDMRDADPLCVDYRHGVSGLLYRFKDLELILSTETLTDWIEQILTLVEAKPLQISPQQTDTYQKYVDALLPNAVFGMQLVTHYIQDRWQSFTTHPGYLKLQRFITEQSKQDLNKPDESLLEDMLGQDNHAMTQQDIACQLLNQSGEKVMDCLYQLLVRQSNDSTQVAISCLVNELVQRRRSSQRWFPDRWAEDKFLVGAIHGQADMGLLLLSVCQGKNLNPFRTPHAEQDILPVQS